MKTFKNRKNIIKKTIDVKGIKMYVLSSVCGILAVGSIFMTIESATGGAEMASLQKKETDLLTKQEELQQSLVEALSVNNLEEQSTSLGFVKVNNLVYVTEAPSVAKLP